MALKYSGMVKTVKGGGDFSLRAEVGESLLVRKIYAYSPNDVYATLRIEKTTVGYFRVSPTYGNHLFFHSMVDTDGATLRVAKRYNLLELLWDLEIFKGYPVGEGETFYISGVTGSSAFVTVVYDIYDAGDQKPENENGSRASEYFFINYGRVSGGISAAGDQLYNKSANPVEFPLFPFGDDVPAKNEITIYGILGKEVGVRNSTPATAIYTQFLKLIKEREVLFDKDRNGFIFDFSLVSGAAGTKVAGGMSQIGDFSSVDPREPLLFPEPLVFVGGEELNIYVTTAEPVDGSTIAEAYTEIGLIEKVKKVT
jgi:hypothetical protein